MTVGAVTEASSQSPNFIVGVGASAGGLEALEKMFGCIPADTGMAFVVVQHLSPDFDSVMDELLLRQTDMPVHTVVDGVEISANAIYLIPRKKEMIISDGKLLLTDKDPGKGLTLPIDQFFRSLAQDAGPKSIGVILSGTGSDGSRGIREIHEAGGLVIVQNEDSAKFDGMPKSAMETGIVDIVLHPEAVADALARYAKHPVASDLIDSTSSLPVNDGALSKLMRRLRDTYGIDFSLYKPSTVTRRIERRLLLTQSTDFERYVEQVATEPEELNSLYRDLLIGVTQFFRDREAFAVLETLVMPELLQRLQPSDEVRVWVAGCATGEEAYSMAILLHEQLVQMDRPINVKIFATDVHQSSLDFASAGLYPKESLSDVSTERLARYFTPKGDAFQVTSEIRQMIVFAPHNIIKDAPFTKLDLVSCRNLLIYLQPNVQKKAISLFHFGLKTGGTLFLGPSEGVGDWEDEFSPVDRHWKMYRKRRDVKLPADLRLTVSGNLVPRVSKTVEVATAESDSELRRAYDQVLDVYVPSGVLIEASRQVVHFFGEAGKFLSFSKGRASTSLLDLCEADLKTSVAGALQRATKEVKSVVYSGVSAEIDGQRRQIQLSVKPLLDRTSQISHFLVTFEEVEQTPSIEPEAIDIGEVSRERITSLELELRYTKENLQATVEELEASNEELHATNEELVASNEELQSTNEELHSVNEELYTVNAEYQRKIGELTQVTDDMDNLLSSTDIGVLFLDNTLCIRRFTPRIANCFNILSQDIGREFDSFSSNIELPGLMDDLRKVAETGQPIEKKACDRFGAWHLLRILPYVSNTEFEGVVLTLVDIQSLRDVEEKLVQKEQQLQGILKNSPSFIFVKDLQGRYVLANERARRFLRTDPNDAVGKTDFDLLPNSIANQLDAQDRKVLSEGTAVEVEQKITRGGKSRMFLSAKYPLRNEQGRIVALAGIITDITRQKQSESRAKRAVKYRDRFLAMLSHELRNPMAAMRNSAEYLRRTQSSDAEIRSVADVVGRQVDQMGRLIEDLLDVSRISRQKVDIRKDVIDLRAIAKEAELAARSLITARQLGLKVELPDEAITVLGDEGRLQQVFVNLLVNAAKYTPAGGQIDFTISVGNEVATVEIKDDGVGMSRELVKRVFEPFVQADETLERSDGGLGVGLTLVRSLVELHNGTVAASSEGKNKGSIFTVTLPLTDRPIDDRPDDEIDEQSVKPLKILVVEDNPDVRDMMQKLLKLDGHEVSEAGDGITALARFEADRPDVALIDIGLPELNGYEVAKRIRKRHGREVVLLVALTGYGQPTDREAAVSAGYDEHLTKPLDMQILRQLLAEVAATFGRSDAQEERPVRRNNV